MKYIIGEERNQYTFLPNCLDEYISEENMVRLIDSFVNILDIEELEFERALPSKTGRPGYNPKDMLKLYIYGYTNRIRSSRRLERESKRNIEIMWLINRLSPDFKTIADFRKNNSKALTRVFREFVCICKKWDLINDKLVAVDGSKFKAWNSKKRNFNNKSLEKKLKNINTKIEEYLRVLDKNDTIEKSERKISTCSITKKIKELEERKLKYEKYKEQINNTEITQISETDPDARLMLNQKRSEVCYNVQSTVESKNKLLIDYEVTNDVNDFKQLSNMGKRAKRILEVEKLEILADKGYNNPTEFKECIDNFINPYVPGFVERGTSSLVDEKFKTKNFIYDENEDVYICPNNKKLQYKSSTKKDNKLYRNYRNSKACKNCIVRSKCTKNKYGRAIQRWEYESIVEKVEKQTKENWDKYSKRQQLVEHPFGTIKRGMDNTYFLTKRLHKVNGEMALTFLAYNMIRVLNILGHKNILKKLVSE